MAYLANTSKRRLDVRFYFFALGFVWTIVVGVSLLWNLKQAENTALEAARIQARTAFEKDIVYRRWNAGHGGVYVPISTMTPPNPYLEVPDRDIPGPDDAGLTKMNPAYMTRQVHEMGALKSGIHGHITSLKPIRPKNAPDPWESRALKNFETGIVEISEIQTVEGQKFMRLMRPLVTEKGCLKCHSAQGYKLGDIRGGISVSVPLAPLLLQIKSNNSILALTHILFWMAGLFVLGFAAQRLSKRTIERRRTEMERERLIKELQAALDEANTLKGFIPICANCKKIRDDEGFWQQIENYISKHSGAQFSHGICPECKEKLYPELENRPGGKLGRKR